MVIVSLVYAYAFTLASVWNYPLAQQYIGELTVAYVGAISAWLPTRGKTERQV